MPRTATQNLSLNQDDKARLRALAAAHGYLIGRGPLADKGSINRLARNLARGRAIFVPLSSSKADSDLTDRLRELAKEHNIPWLNEVADAVEWARQIREIRTEE